MDTLFPKIRRPRDAIEKYRWSRSKELGHDSPQCVDDKLEVVGSVKLHGTHADVVVTADDRIFLQSRNITDIVAAKNDNYGFGEAMKHLEKPLLKIKQRYLERFRELNPAEAISDEFPFILAGEWAGGNIQKNVALTQLPKCFVIITASIIGRWTSDEEYGDIADEDSGIYNISRGGFFHEILDLGDETASMNRIRQLTNAVDSECPFSRSLGVSGPGEGIVWKISKFRENPEYWFKTKGPRFEEQERHGTAHQSKEEMLAQKTEEGRAKQLVNRIVTIRRLEQGHEYLREHGQEIDQEALHTFSEWVVKDCFDEERHAILDADCSEIKVKEAIRRKANAWYMGMLKAKEKRKS